MVKFCIQNLLSWNFYHGATTACLAGLSTHTARLEVSAKHELMCIMFSQQGGHFSQTRLNITKTLLILFANLNEFLGNSVEGLVTLEREGVANDGRAG